MTRWRDTLPENVILAEKLDGERVRFNELQVGDVFRAVSPIDGGYIDPTHHFETDSLFRVTDNPRQLDGTECAQDFGWGMMVEEVDPDSVRSFLN